jgi:hypothetical protein
MLSVLEFYDLGIFFVREVMAGKAVNNTRANSLTKGLTIIFCTQWRIDLKVGIIIR